MSNNWKRLLSQVNKEEFSDLSNGVIVYEPDRDLDSFPKGCTLTVIALSVSSSQPPETFFEYDLKLEIDLYDIECCVGHFRRIWNTDAVGNNADIEQSIRSFNDSSKSVLIITDRDYVCHRVDYGNIRILHSSNF